MLEKMTNAELLQLIDEIFPDEIEVSYHVRRNIIIQVCVSQIGHFAKW